MMLSCPHHHHPCLHVHRHCRRHRQGHSNPTTTVSSCLLHVNHNQQYQNAENPTAAAAATHVSILRTHNAKSTGLLLHHLKHPGQPHETLPQLDAIPQEEKVKLQEMSLITKKRIPQFPGSISEQITPNANINSPLRTLFRDENDSEQKEEEEEEEDEEMVMRALEIRRKVTSEIFKQAMMKGKFGITYSTNLADNLGDFLDFVMIEAAALKRLPEFEFTSFNVRARTVIDDLKVVPLVRYWKISVMLVT